MEFRTGYQASGNRMIRRDARSEIHENFRNAAVFSSFASPRTSATIRRWTEGSLHGDAREKFMSTRGGGEARGGILELSAMIQRGQSCHASVRNARRETRE